MNYLLKFKRKRTLRLLMRHNYNICKVRSSLYKLDNFYYIVLNCAGKLDCISDSILVIVNDRSTPEEYLFKWAVSEIEQAHAYIQFEQNSWLSDVSRCANVDDTTVYRCFEPVADVFAILNYTPDSFSDGGQFNQVEKALKHVEHLCQSGATIIDLGVESTRPGNRISLDTNAEINLLRQILPPILELKAELGFELSVDTYHKETILWLADLPIDIINDVSGNTPLDIIKLLFNNNKRYVAMHSLSIPVNPAIILESHINPVEYLAKWMRDKIQAITEFGVDTTSLILDPGIGFGLDPAQSWFTLRNIVKLGNIPCEILVGSSRKSFFTHITDKPAHQRDIESASVAARVLPHVDYLRLHELTYFNQVNRVFNQIS